MTKHDSKRMAIRLLLALAVVGVVVGGASGSAVACDHWFDPPEDDEEPEYCNDSIAHEFQHLVESPAVALFAVGLVGVLFTLGRR